MKNFAAVQGEITVMQDDYEILQGSRLETPEVHGLVPQDDDQSSPIFASLWNNR